MRLAVLLLFMSICFSSCLSDLRPKDYRSSEKYTDEAHKKGVEILKRYAEVSGQEKWNTINSYQIYFNDDFYGLLGKYGQPFKNKKNQFKLDYYPQENSGTLLFLNGKKKGEVWGYNEGNTYYRESINSPIIDKEKKGIRFWVPTYQYFIELPFRISNADVIYHVGEEKYGLETYDKVLITWKKAEPQRKLDQYLLWVNQNTGLVHKMQYTIRDQGSFFVGTALIDDHYNYDGIVIPSIFKVYLKEKSTKPLHIMRPYNFVVTSKI